MAPKPLNILKKGLEKFSTSIKTRKDALTLKLSRRESISSADERWLDFEANTVDEEHILNDLERASDYERGLERLDADGKAIVKKLRELAGDLMKVAGNKQKRAYMILCFRKHNRHSLLKALSTRSAQKKFLNLVSLQPQLFRFLQRKRMQLWSKESRFSIGIINRAKTRVQQQSTLIHSTLIFNSSSRLSQPGLNMKPNGARNGHRPAKHLTGVPNKFNKQSTQKFPR